MTTTYDKDGAYIEITVDGVVHRRSIKWEDCVVSVPSGANLKIDLAYVNSSDQLVLVLEDESEIIMTALEDLSTHDTDIKALLATIAAYIDTEVATILAAVDNEVAAIEVKLDTPANFMADTTALALEATLTAIKGGGWSTQTLVALKTAIDAIPTVMVGTNGAALASAWSAALATILGNFSQARIEYLDQLDFNLAEAIAAIKTILDTPANFMANLTTLETRLSAIRAAYLDEAISTPKAILSSDWKGNFNWDTDVYTTDETDISALFSTNLALDTRRKYSVKLDLTAVEADGSFISLYLAVKEKIDGTNYRAIDRKIVLKADIAAAAEPGIVIDIPATSENIQITMQMSAALAGDATIYYAVVKEHLE